MRKQITVTVTKIDNATWKAVWGVNKSDIHYEYIQGKIEKMFGRTPDNYKVIYKLDRKGNLTCNSTGDVVTLPNKEYVITCFLKGLGWENQTVSRKVVPL